MTNEFIRALKLFIARRGRPCKIYNDNAQTFISAAKWVKRIVKNEKVNDYIAQQEILWQFKLSQAPWWGGQFERLISLIKVAMYKTIGKNSLMWYELEKVLMDIEITLNKRPLSYVKDDIQMPILTPNTMIHGISISQLDKDVSSIEDKDLIKRARYIQKCKNLAWQRWTTEYLKALREHHNLRSKAKKNQLSKGDVVLIQGDQKNRGRWNIGIVMKLNSGRDGAVRSARIKCGKSMLERAIQHLCLVELSCDLTTETGENSASLNVNAREYITEQTAAVAAKLQIRDAAEYERKLPTVE